MNIRPSIQDVSFDDGEREPKRSQSECAGPQAASSSSCALGRTRQASRIRDLRQALIDAGYKSLDQQATALGLCRSTTWTVLRGDHKCTGLQAALVARMWVAPNLPPTARTILASYISEKSQGSYGHNEDQRERFTAQLRRFPLFADLGMPVGPNMRTVEDLASRWREMANHVERRRW